MFKSFYSRPALLLLLVWMIWNPLKAQLTTTASTNAAQLVQTIMGPGITVSNVTMNCPNGAAGTFNGAATNIGINSGVLLTSGSVAIAAQPNLGGGSGVDNFGAGDAQLTALGGNQTFDACALEFDFVALCDTISIAYVFASDEYDEYVCASVNDVFGFFLTGPGYANTNIALVPGTGTPVSINTVNNGSVGAFGMPGPGCVLSNATYYTSNATTTHEYDGQTVRMVATAAVTPCATYHVKLVIADGGDGIYDSGVFFAENGINCNQQFLNVTAGVNSGASSAVEGCINGFFTFDRDGDSTLPYTFTYVVGGTATSGVDYNPLSGTATFGALQTTITIPVNVINDAIAEGSETVYVIVSDTVCGIVQSDTAYLTISDNLIVSAGPDVSTCAGSPVGIGDTTIAGMTYLWTPSTGLSSTSVSNPTVTLNTNGTFQYIVTATNGGACSGRDTVNVIVTNQPTSPFTLPADACAGEDVTVTFTGSASPAATFNWDFGGATVISGSGAGPYTLEWTTPGTINVTLLVSEGPCSSAVTTHSILIGASPSLAPVATNVSCFGANDGSIITNPSGGTLNYTFSWNTGATTQNLNNIPGGFYEVTITDALGCQDTDTFTIQSPAQINITVDLAQNVSCAGGNDGCIAITASGGAGNFSYLWSNGATVDSICGLTAGTYTITVTDTTYSGGSNNLYFEDFDGTHGWTLNVPTGPNGVDNNFWLVEDNEGGVLPPGCGVANNGDSTLHITSVFNPTGGAAYDAGGLCGLLFCPETNMRAESPIINATGVSNMTLSFDYISNGQGLLDNASVMYFDGAVWSALNPSIKSVVCISGQGQWTAFSAALPASANNNPNIRVGINWTNNDDGLGSDPSVAINNVSVTSGLAQSFTVCTATETIVITEPSPLAVTVTGVDIACFGDSTGCVTATASGGNGTYTYLWNTGDTTATVCGLPIGTYVVTVTDTTGSGGAVAVNVTVFDEDFDGPNSWTLNVPTGPNGADPNFWLVEDNEGGVLPPGCGVANNGDSTLHITSVFNPTGGAAYDAGGLCGLLFCPETNARAESPAFSTLGLTTATLTFDFISQGDALLDNCSVQYNDGTGWQVLSPSIKSLVCGNGQGQWQAATFALPASCINNPAVRVGFNWTNNDDGLGSDPSVAINNVRVSGLSLSGGGGGTGCFVVDSITLTQPTQLLVSSSGVDAICNQNNGSVSATASGGTLNYTFNWSNGQNGASLSNLSAGTYTVTVTDGNGCTETSSVTILQLGSPALTLVSQTNVTCFGQSNGSATVSAAGGVGPYAFTWSNGQSGTIVNGLSGGPITVTVTDANNCTDVLTVNITEPTQLAGTLIATDVSCWATSNPNGTIGVIMSGGTPPLSYVWNTAPIQTTSYATGLSPGTYTVTVTDGNGCTFTATGTVDLQPSPTVTAGPDAQFCEGDGGALIYGLASGGTPGYSFVWWCDSTNTFCGLDSLNDNDPIANPTSTTWYYVQVVDTNGCRSNVDSLIVRVLDKPEVNAGPDHIICGDSAPCTVLTPTVSGAPGPFTYQWLPSTGLNNPNIQNPCARPDTTTIYTLVVTAGNGCASDYNTVDTNSTVTVFVNPVPIADAGPDREICYGDSTMLQGIGHGAGPVYDFEWSPATGLSSTSAVNPMASPPATTEYILVVWSNGCPSYGDTVLVDVHTLPTVDAGWDREICWDGTAQLDAQASGDSTATYTYLWTPALGLNDPNIEDPQASPSLTTTYYVQAQSSFGCRSALDSATVYMIPTPMAEAGPSLFICGGDTSTLQGSIYYLTAGTAPASEIIYSWTPGSTLSDTTVLQPSVWPTASGWYNLAVHYRTCVTYDSVLVTLGPAASAMADADTLVICGEDSVQLLSTGSVGTNIHWWPATGLADANAANPMASPTATTTYYLSVGTGSCSDTAAVTVAVLPMPQAEFVSSLTEGCVPHTVSFTDASSGELNYIWNFGDGSQVNNGPNPVHTYTTAGIFPVTLIVQSEGGCSDTALSVMVNVLDTAIASFVSDPMFPVELSIPGGVVHFQSTSVNAVNQSWNFGDGHSTNGLNPSHNFTQPGTYHVTLTVENAMGCISTFVGGPFIIRIPDLFIPNVFSPNGDGVNDLFLVEYTGSQPFTLQIFDRWGGMMYSSLNQTEGWDGKNLNGDDVPDGVYYYLVRTGNREFTGVVTLMR